MDGSAAPLDEVGRRSSPRMSNCHVGSACRSRCGRDDSGVARRGWGAFTTPEERATSTRRVPGGLAMVCVVSSGLAMVCRLPGSRLSTAQKLRSSEAQKLRRNHRSSSPISRTTRATSSRSRAAGRRRRARPSRASARSATSPRARCSRCRAARATARRRSASSGARSARRASRRADSAGGDEMMAVWRVTIGRPAPTTHRSNGHVIARRASRRGWRCRHDRW